MRITIEPTTKQDGEELEVNHRVVIEHPYDHLTIITVVGMIEGALVAYGYDPETVKECLAEDL